MKQSKIILWGLLFALFALGSANGAARTKCTNPTIAVILAPGSGGLMNYNIFGDGVSTYHSSTDAEFDGGTYYDQGGSFNTCLETPGSGTRDLTLKFAQGQGTGRYFNILFPGTPLAPPDVAHGAVDLSGGEYQGFFFNVREAYDTPVGSSLDTCYIIGVPVGSTSYGLRFANPNSYATCGTENLSTSITNTPDLTSLVRVTHPDNCTWYVRPLLDDTGLNFRAGLSETLAHGKTVSGGQYNMPFAIKVIEMNCTP